jgi:hypothetical protein
VCESRRNTSPSPLVESGRDGRARMRATGRLAGRLRGRGDCTQCTLGRSVTTDPATRAPRGCVGPTPHARSENRTACAVARRFQHDLFVIIRASKRAASYRTLTVVNRNRSHRTKRNPEPEGARPATYEKVNSAPTWGRLSRAGLLSNHSQFSQPVHLRAPQQHGIALLRSSS